MLDGKVLILEYMPFFDNKTAIRIKHQDKVLIERGKFCDNELRIKSINRLEYKKSLDMLYIRGVEYYHDDDVIFVENEYIESIKKRVKKLNKKYMAIKI